MPTQTIPIRVDTAEKKMLDDWKVRYETKIGHPVNWPQLLLAYANSKVFP